MVDIAASAALGTVTGKGVDHAMREAGIGEHHESSVARTNELLARLVELFTKSQSVYHPKTVVNLATAGVTVIHISPARYRDIEIFVSGAPGDRFCIKIGATDYFFVTNVSGNLLRIPLPILLHAGMEISIRDVTTPASVLWDAYLQAQIED